MTRQQLLALPARDAPGPCDCVLVFQTGISHASGAPALGVAGSRDGAPFLVSGGSESVVWARPRGAPRVASVACAREGTLVRAGTNNAIYVNGDGGSATVTLRLAQRPT